MEDPTTLNHGVRANDPAHWPREQGAIREPIVEHRLGPDVASSGGSARKLGLRHRRLRISASESWPPEPAAPTSVARERFEHALTQLCPADHARSLAAPILESAERFAIDPFLLAALTYQQTRCDARHADAYGIGVTRIDPEKLEHKIRGGMYRYRRPDRPGHLVPIEIPVGRYPFTRRALRAPGPNLYFAAAQLRALSEQCPAIDHRFGGVSHRHFVSHVAWEDRVRATSFEDEILIARRRLLDYYAPRTRKMEARVGNVALASPLDGAPRSMMGVIGELRDGGRRIHLGIDLDGARGEPVRAMAAGIVTFAGVDLRARGLTPLDPLHAREVPPAAMGPRGLFVRIAHADGVESLYAHLDRYEVQVGQSVRAGQALGEVGRTGMQASDSHLHLGLFVDGIAIDPGPILEAYAVRAAPLNPPPPVREEWKSAVRGSSEIQSPVR
jgi:murein DD-endopeptidase MepM/ murein hydrolase activator NlpD